MKKTLLFLSIVCLCVAHVAAQQPGTKPKTITIGLVAKSQSNPVFIAAYAGARVAAKALSEKHKMDVYIEWQTPQNEDAAQQAASIEKLARSGAAGIAVACSDAAILTPAINKAVDGGVQVVCFDSDAPQSKRFAYYGSDDHEFGRMVMKDLAKEMKEKGVIAILGGNKNAPNLQRRVHAVIEELKNYPGMSLLPNGEYYHEETPEKAAAVVSRAQNANQQIGGWAFVGGWPLFTKDAIKWKPGQIKIVAADALPPQLEYLKSGHVQSLIAQNCFMWGHESVVILFNKIVMNQSPAQQITTSPLAQVTKENLEEWNLYWQKWLFKEAVSQ